MVLMNSTSIFYKPTYQISGILWEISQLNLIDRFQLSYLSAQMHTFDY